MVLIGILVYLLMGSVYAGMIVYCALRDGVSNKDIGGYFIVSAIIGTFLVGIYTWNSGIKHGLIYTALSIFITNISFWLLLGKVSINPVMLMGMLSYVVVALISAYISHMHSSLKDTKKLLEEDNKKNRVIDS